jgi:xylulokinase
MSRSVLEGVALSARLAFEALQASAGQMVQGANIGGGGARSDLWCQIRADALGFPLRRAAINDSAALGAAILAGLGSGLLGSLGEAIQNLVRFDRVFDPNPDHRSYYADKFEDYRSLYETLRPFNARFAT